MQDFRGSSIHVPGSKGEIGRRIWYWNCMAGAGMLNIPLTLSNGYSLQPSLMTLEMLVLKSHTGVLGPDNDYHITIR